MTSVTWTEPAYVQLEHILGYIALDKPEVAKRLAKQIMAKVGRLAEFPGLGKAVPELAHPDYRQLWIKPCWIYYRIAEQTIFVLHVRRAERPLNPADLFIS